MPAKFTIKVMGADKVVAMLGKKKEDIQKAVTTGVNKAALFIEGEVKESISGHKTEPVSVDTGNFLRSPTTKMLGKSEAEVYSDTRYAKHLEFGTSRMNPRWHFRNTKMRNEKKVQDIIRGEVKQVM